MDDTAQREGAEGIVEPSRREPGHVRGDVVEVADSKPEEVMPKPKLILGGKRRAVKVKDTQTEFVYDSKSKAGKALAEEFGLDPKDNFVWYKILKAAPDRFKEVE